MSRNQRSDGSLPRSRAPGGRLSAAGRATGFLIFASMGLAMLAAIVLLPSWCRLRAARFELERTRARTAELRAELETWQRLNAEGPEDPAHLQHLAQVHFGWTPVYERTPEPRSARLPVLSAAEPVRVTPQPRPTPPNDWLAQAAARMQAPGPRRGMFLLSAMCLAAAFLLFAPPTHNRG